MSLIENTSAGPAAITSGNGATAPANSSTDGTGGKNTPPREARYDHIVGWGIDIDPNNDPTYPIKHRTDEEQAGKTWERPTQQEKTVTILTSNEHKSLPAVFGTTLPPKGISGALRKFAFRYSESDYKHWLPLMLADRIHVIESRILDLAHGHVPNIVAERGLRAEWKYNRKKCVTKAVTTAVIASAAVALVLVRKNRAKNGRGMLEVAAEVLQKMPKVS